MKTFKAISLVLFLLCSVHIANAQVLAKQVSIQFQNITLNDAIKKIKTTTTPIKKKQSLGSFGNIFNIYSSFKIRSK